MTTDRRASLNPPVPQTFEEMRAVLDQFLRRPTPDASRMWDLLTGLRGPDTPSERADMDPVACETAYRARRKRKRRTTEVIRGHSFPGIGGARYRIDTREVVVPPANQQDHFDRHVIRAASALGLTIIIQPKETA